MTDRSVDMGEKDYHVPDPGDDEWYWDLYSKTTKGFCEPTWAYNELALRHEMGLWVKGSILYQERVRWGCGHDEPFFVNPWFGYYFLTGDERVLRFIYKMRDEFLRSPMRRDYARVEGREGHSYMHAPPELYKKAPESPVVEQYHGWPEAWVCFHHASEGYSFFIGSLPFIDPGNTRNIEAVEDVAHHIGNWVDEVPDWYDWENHRFRGWHLGTRIVGGHPAVDADSQQHFRLINIALTAYAATGKKRYLDLSKDYADKWAKIIRESKEGIPFNDFPITDAEKIKEIYRTEELPPSWIERKGADPSLIDGMLDLYRITSDPKYALAVKKVIDIAPTHPAEQTHISRYRAFTRDTSYDERIIEYIRTQKGEVEPRTLMLGYQISRDINLLERALEKATARFQESTPLKDGREHGCDGRYRHAWAFRYVVTTLYPAVFGGYTIARGEFPWFEVKYRREGGLLGLPEGVAALFVPTNRDERLVYLYNDNEKDAAVEVWPENTQSKISNVSTDRKAWKNYTDKAAKIVAYANKVVEVRVKLAQ